MQYLTKAEIKALFKTYLKNNHATKDLRRLYEFGRHGIDTVRKLLDEYLMKLHGLLDTIDFDKLIQFYFKITDLFSIVELGELGDSKAKTLIQQLKPLVEDYFLNKKSPLF
ncbi:hypothetical protein LCGC14_1822880 [marine sediment metagenome]|uniref:Uncharacterized protein n=1 Tax=marine sediment metagenome TaxID=412755 RepID=A0A0F9JHV1_9ZZZZ